MQRIEATLTSIRPTRSSDVAVLVAWHADPEVSRYWDGETFTAEQILDRLERPDVDSYIVEEQGTPVGYIQAWTEEGRRGGLDMFLIAGARGRGLGPDAAQALARHLRDTCGWTRITVDPYTWNEKAIRAWLRAGFAAVGEREPDDEHTSRWLLMEFAG